MKYSVVIPVYNERDNLAPLYGALVESLGSLGAPYEIVLVDDGSRDCSSNVLRQLAEQDPAVKVVELAANFGQTAALSAGIEHASGEIVITLDADLQNDPADIPRLVERLEQGYDLVYGWRRQRNNRLVSRRLPSIVANWLIRRVTGFAGHDIGCTLKAMRRETAQALPLYGDMHRFIPVLAQADGARCSEVVVRHHARRFGQSKYGMLRTVRVACDLLSVRFFTGYAACPMRFFGRLAFGSAALAVAAAAGGLCLAAWDQAPQIGGSLWAVAAVFLLGAVQCTGLGLLGEIVSRTYFESGNRRPYRVRTLHNFEPTLGQVRDRADGQPPARISIAPGTQHSAARRAA